MTAFPEKKLKAFRIPATSGSKLICSVNDHQIEFDIINVSETGLLISLKNKSHRKINLFEGKKLNNLLLSVSQKDNPININIGSVEIIRSENAKISGRINYGLKFIDIDIREQDELRRLIYYCQRKELQKRGGLELKK